MKNVLAFRIKRKLADWAIGLILLACAFCASVVASFANGAWTIVFGIFAAFLFCVWYKWIITPLPPIKKTKKRQRDIAICIPVNRK